MEHYSAIEKNEILSYVTTWMDLEGIMLNKSEKDGHHMFPLFFFVFSRATPMAYGDS